jgi:predicted flavoprotein YhiN
VVDETAFSGSTPPAIRNVLRRFSVADTVRFFAEQNVSLKREATGKRFPVTDRAKTVLEALFTAAGNRVLRSFIPGASTTSRALREVSSCVAQRESSKRGA